MAASATCAVARRRVSWRAGRPGVISEASPGFPVRRCGRRGPRRPAGRGSAPAGRARAVAHPRRGTAPPR